MSCITSTYQKIKWIFPTNSVSFRPNRSVVKGRIVSRQWRFAAFEFAPSSRKPRSSVWLEQRLAGIRLQLLQAESRHQEDLVGSQARLRDGGWRPGLDRVHGGGAVCHSLHGPKLLRPLDWLIHAGRTAPASNPRTPACIKWSHVPFSSLLRNATRFRVRSNKETHSSAGLMQSCSPTQTGLPTKQLCKCSQGVYLLNLVP